jgi:hypothetical protein
MRDRPVRHRRRNRTARLTVVRIALALVGATLIMGAGAEPASGTAARVLATGRLVTLRGTDVLYLKGTKMRCVIFDSNAPASPVGLECFVVDPNVEMRTFVGNAQPLPKIGSYVVRVTFWGGGLMTRADRGDTVRVGGFPVVTPDESIVYAGRETLPSTREHNYPVGGIVTVPSLHYVTAQVGDVVRVASSPIECVFTRAAGSAPTVGCVLVNARRVPIPGAWGFILSDGGAALGKSGSGGLRFVYSRSHGR